MATASTLLRDHVSFELRSIDRIFLHAYAPGLQTMGQVIKFLGHKGYPIPSPVALGRIGKAFIAALDRFAADHDIPKVRFVKRQSKEDVARPYLQAAQREGRFGVVLVGVAQEKALAWRSFKTGGRPSHPHFEFRRQSVFVNHYYFYVLDRDFGPVFFKLCPYAPYSVWIWCNGHEWAKRRAASRGLAFTELDNGFAQTDDPPALQAICDSLNATDVRTLVERWLRALPSPFSDADRAAGFWYDVAVRQIEFSDTCVFDRPINVRLWFEAVIRDHLDLGRPDQIALVFSRRVTKATPGRFWTRVITRGVTPLIQAHYRASKVKQYLKGDRALRTETTINDTRDFGIGRRLRTENLVALKQAGFGVNARLVELELSDRECSPDAATVEQVVLPSRLDGLPAPALRFGDPRVVALLGALACCAHVPAGFTNASMRGLVEDLWGRPYSARQMTYDLRRLRRKGFIARDSGAHRYRLTAHGRHLALFFSRLYARVVTPALTELDPHLPAHIDRTPLARASRDFDRAVAHLAAASGILAA